jgi:hypothetical protein
MLALLMAVLVILLPMSQSFTAVVTRPLTLPACSKIYMASQIEMEEQVPTIGPTERLLLEAKNRRDSGIIQEYGRTVMNDSLDGIRELVWAIFNLSNVVFTGLGILMVLAMALNVAGYGYYMDGGDINSSSMFQLHIDTLENIRQAHYFEEEMGRVANFVMEHKQGVSSTLL